MTTKINQRQQKFFLVLPLLVLPFIILLFWAMGGGKSAEAQTTKGALTGLNMQLPGAQLKTDSTETKLSIYQQAEKDSLKFRQAQKDDPYYRQDSAATDSQASPFSYPDERTSISPAGSNGTYAIRSASRNAKSLHSNEQRLNEKLALLNRQINQLPTTAADAGDSQQHQLTTKQLPAAAVTGTDPEMAQLSSMLDKIQEIQNPGLARQKLQQQSAKNRGQVFAVTTGKKEMPVSTLDQPGNLFPIAGNGFYSLENNDAPQPQNAIEAVIHESQTLVNGATVKLRLVNDVFINGVLIPKDNFVFGEAALNGDRLAIKISSIRYHNSLFPVELSAFDMDGLSGIYIPGAISRDVAKESADQSIQNLGLTAYNPSLGAQAVTAGVGAAKSLFSKKVRLIRVTVKAGYRVLLRDEQQKQNS